MKVIKNLIIDNINLNDGYITLDKFINTSMYDQKYGYYIRKNPIGKVQCDCNICRKRNQGYRRPRKNKRTNPTSAR